MQPMATAGAWGRETGGLLCSGSAAVHGWDAVEGGVEGREGGQDRTPPPRDVWI
jgi:hypothetical protein